MADKTQFSDLVANEDRVTLPEKCCAHCQHGRKLTDAAQLGRTMFQCRALPPVPVLMMSKNGPVVQSMCPTLDPAFDCDTFAPRKEQN